MIDVVMPQMGESIVEGTLTKWLKKAGDHVERDEPLFEISTDKVDAEIPSPAGGVLTEIRAKEGETVAVNSVVAVIGAAGDRAAQPSRPAPAAVHPRELPAAPTAPSPSVANSALEREHMQQQQALQAQQAQERQRLQQQQELEHQRVAKQQADAARTQELERQHAQQTQQMQQAHMQAQQQLAAKQEEQKQAAAKAGEKRKPP